MDNLDKLLEAIEHPDRFSDAELHQLISDPETRQLYHALCASRSEAFLKDSTTDESEIEQQWQRFRMKRHKQSLFSWIRNRKIAAVVAVLIVSCSIIVVGVSLSNKFLGSGDKQTAEQPGVVDQILETVAPVQAKPLNDTIIVL